MLALRYNIDGGFLLLSHDGGKTYEDITPDVFIGHRDVYNTLASLDQHPTDPDKLLVSSSGKGVFQSTDFGKTWQELTDYFLGNESASFIGYHPLSPSVIYNSGEDWINSPRLNVSYDGGLTWEDHSPYFPGDNCVHRIAFHPTDPSRWIAGGEGVVYTTADNGRSWNTQDYWDNDLYAGYWYFTLYDAENSDIVYMAGAVSSIAKIMCSTDGGETWAVPQFESMDRLLVNDFQQYGDKLLIYTETDVYEVSKEELLARSATSVKGIPTTTQETSAETFDLQGRLVSNPGQGLYIRHGKKAVIR